MIRKVKDIYLLLNEQYPVYTRVFRFLFSGGISLGTDLALLYLFTDIFGIWYLTSAVMAFILAFGVSFTLQKFWTFGDHSREDMRMQMGVYFLVAVVNLGLNTFLVYTFVELTSLHYIISYAHLQMPRTRIRMDKALQDQDETMNIL